VDLRSAWFKHLVLLGIIPEKKGERHNILPRRQGLLTGRRQLSKRKGVKRQRDEDRAADADEVIWPHLSVRSERSKTLGRSEFQSSSHDRVNTKR